MRLPTEFLKETGVSETQIDVTSLPERVGRATGYQNRYKYHEGVTGRHQSGPRSPSEWSCSACFVFCLGSPRTSHEHLSLWNPLLRKNVPSKSAKIFKKYLKKCLKTAAFENCSLFLQHPPQAFQMSPECKTGNQVRAAFSLILLFSPADLRILTTRSLNSPYQ